MQMGEAIVVVFSLAVVLRGILCLRVVRFG